MKLSQSNFNLGSPDCYLVHSYLIATVFLISAKTRIMNIYVSFGWKNNARHEKATTLMKVCIET